MDARFAKMSTALEPDEAPIMAGLANMERGIEAVGGQLYLTDRRLVFESHRFNVQTGATELPLSEIASVEPCWSRLLALIPLVPNGLLVTTRSGEAHRFVLWGRAAWIEAIRQQLGAVSAA